MKTHLNPIGTTDTWITPQYITDQLSTFDLDPCAHTDMPWQHAKKQYTINEDGLTSDWFGRVWLNPPFNRYQIGAWMEKMSYHKKGLMLISAATETARFKKFVWGKAHSILFMDHRPYFCDPEGNKGKANCGQSMCIVSYSEQDTKILRGSGLGFTLKIQTLS